MFKLFRYRLLRHVPVKRIKEHYERKYRTYLCENKLMDYDTLTASDIFKNNALNVPKENFDNVALNIASDGNSVTIEKNPRVGRISIEIKGKNNKIRLGDMSEIVGTLDIHICGNDSETDIGNIWIGKGGLTIYNAVAQSQNTRVFIGDGCTFESCTIISYHSNTSVVVGEKCMFSDGITLINSDTHPIYDYETKELSNKAKRDIVIGKHCWVGHGVSVMKNVSVPDDSIIGWNAVVTKSFDESHCAIAGNPAKIVKRGVTWDCFDENLFV